MELKNANPNDDKQFQLSFLANREIELKNKHHILFF
jgi:hypothetical protein